MCPRCEGHVLHRERIFRGAQNGAHESERKGQLIWLQTGTERAPGRLLERVERALDFGQVVPCSEPRRAEIARILIDAGEITPRDGPGQLVVQRLETPLGFVWRSRSVMRTAVPNSVEGSRDDRASFTIEHEWKLEFGRGMARAGQRMRSLHARIVSARARTGIRQPAELPSEFPLTDPEVLAVSATGMAADGGEQEATSLRSWSLLQRSRDSGGIDDLAVAREAWIAISSDATVMSNHVFSHSTTG